MTSPSSALIVVISTALSCAAQQQRIVSPPGGCAAMAKYVQSPIWMGPPGAQWWTIPSSAQLQSKDGCLLATVTKYEGPHKSYWKTYEGTLFEIPVENGVDGKAVEVSQKAFLFGRILYKGPGPRARWTYVPDDNGKIRQYVAENGREVVWQPCDQASRVGCDPPAGVKEVQVGEQSCQGWTADDATRINCMTRGFGSGERWAGEPGKGGKVYQEKEPGKAVQVGSYTRLWVTPVGSQRLAIPIIMSKGMGKDAKWCGEKDSVLYLEK